MLLAWCVSVNSILQPYITYLSICLQISVPINAFYFLTVSFYVVSILVIRCRILNSELVLAHRHFWLYWLIWFYVCFISDFTCVLTDIIFMELWIMKLEVMSKSELYIWINKLIRGIYFVIFLMLYFRKTIWIVLDML